MKPAEPYAFDMTLQVLPAGLNALGKLGSWISATSVKGVGCSTS
jgi:hypothetical protein